MVDSYCFFAVLNNLFVQSMRWHWKVSDK